MTAADARCGLFTPDVSAALSAARMQARGAALRSGADLQALRVLEREANDKGASADCSSRDIAVAAARVRDAFAGYARTQRITYPGDQAGWRADRTGPGDIRWRLAQEARFGRDRMTFGLAGRQTAGVLLAVAEFADGQAPYGARLLLRDDRRCEAPYLDGPNTSARGLPLDHRLPPRSALRAYPAEARSPAGADLLPKNGGGGWAFRFPAQAARDLARLDPREAIAVEYLFPGDVVRRAYIEVGDFAAGRAFLALSAR
ncbi:MAG TPA: hypothetical protein VJS38_01135 [Phenylobacterium sp.]|uniref:hypothetical protein n=1 Tax=Phenylobacterium sp. TaxID=1871053 RepID=UPI002B4905E2|nr:hypothetical protein [Phenylobacterium sp.]HKR86756.1 hypothetical protein [Phenylobacterium sp.]